MLLIAERTVAKPALGSQCEFASSQPIGRRADEAAVLDGPRVGAYHPLRLKQVRLGKVGPAPAERVLPLHW